MLRQPLSPCVICSRDAYWNNYGVICCNACKMFFYRVIKLRKKYTCTRDNSCYKVIPRSYPQMRCRACRFQKCLEMGMSIEMSSFEVQMADEVAALINELLCKESARNTAMLEQFTFADPTVEQLILGERLHLQPREGFKPTSKQWSFFSLLTTQQFFLRLEFMSQLDFNDKLILLVKFCSKASCAFKSLTSVRMNINRLIHPDGNEVFCNQFRTTFYASDALLDRISYTLTTKLIELKITDEEFLLLIVILFCDAGHENLSEQAKEVVGANQKTVCSALLHYCNVTYQRSGPSRFSELLSLCHVINKFGEYLQSLSTIMQMSVPDLPSHNLMQKMFYDEQ